MYGEILATQTAHHLREHIEAYLEEVETYYNDNIRLAVPKAINLSSVVGGLFTEFDSILPQYSIDVLGKTVVPEGVSLFTWEYQGQINGMVHANSDQTVTKMCSRHATAVEMFIRNHELLHQFPRDEFKTIGFGFTTIEFSGAEDLGEVEGVPLWMAGFSINISWFTSEDGPFQHA